jgi:hypothetical protein
MSPVSRYSGWLFVCLARHRPSTLAQELESGTTGIPALDQLLSDKAAPNPGFQRAAMLLIGPTVGTTPQFAAALYQAIALLPGVTALGPITTHDGATGERASPRGPGVDSPPSSSTRPPGQLLEVRGLDDSDSLSSIAPNYLDGGPMVVNEYSAQLQWLDPIGSPSVIGLWICRPGYRCTSLPPRSLDCRTTRHYCPSITSCSRISASSNPSIRGGEHVEPQLAWSVSVDVRGPGPGPGGGRVHAGSPGVRSVCLGLRDLRRAGDEPGRAAP